MSRGKFTLRNPAEAIAVSKCWLNTWARTSPQMLPKAETFHPETCAFCEQPRDLLIQALEEFRDWSSISSLTDDGLMPRLEIEQWLSLPVFEQNRLVAKAQADGHKEVGAAKKDPWWSD